MKVWLAGKGTKKDWKGNEKEGEEEKKEHIQSNLSKHKTVGYKLVNAMYKKEPLYASYGPFSHFLGRPQKVSLRFFSVLSTSRLFYSLRDG